jgi:Icc-related predicted phosphoesterase
MRLVIISDTHGSLINDLPDGDVLIHCGDFSSFGKLDETKKFFSWFSKQQHRHKIAIPGNHEVGICPVRNPKGREDIMQLIKSYENVNFLVDKELVIDGVKFYGTPWCGGDPYIMYRWGFYICSNEQRKYMFNKIPSDTDVLISHSPPHGILDFYRGHLGCKQLLDKVMEVKPKVHLFGHIHGGNGHVEYNGINFFNCSNLTESYKLDYPVRIIELDNSTVTDTSTKKVSQETETDEVLVINKGLFVGNCVYCNNKVFSEETHLTTNGGTMCEQCHFKHFD